MRRVKGSVQEKNGHLWLVVSAKDPMSGRRKRRWVRLQAKGVRAAENEAIAKLHALKMGALPPTSKLTLAQYLEHWLATIKPTISARTFERYQEICRKNIAPLLGAVVLTDLRVDPINAAYAKLLAPGWQAGKRALSARTVRHIHTVLKAALEHAVARQEPLLPRNPANGATPPRVEPKQMETYGFAETQQLLEAMRGTRMYVPVLLAVLSGMRRGEVAALQWKHVDLDTGTMAIKQAVEHTRGSVKGKSLLRLKTPKSGRSRVVALSATMVTELRAYRLQQAEELLRLGVLATSDTFVCAKMDGEMIHPMTLTQQFERLLRTRLTRNGFRRLTYHGLRHCHATHMLARNVHPKVVSERLGHSRIGITMDTYSHAIPTMQAEAVALVDEELGKAVQGSAFKSR